MDSENLQRVWERIAEAAAKETDPKKHLKLIDELLQVMAQLQAAPEENKKTEGPPVK